MSTLPRDVRISTIHEIGVKVDDYLDAAKSETLKREGAQAAYLNTAKNIMAVMATLERELTNASEHAEHVPYAKLWVKKCLLVCEDLANQAGNLAAAAKGAEKQTSSIVALLKQLHDLEVVKKRRETEILATLPLLAEPVKEATKVEKAPEVAPKVRNIPRRTIKEIRLAEAAEAERLAAIEAAEKAASKTAKKAKGSRRKS